MEPSLFRIASARKAPTRSLKVVQGQLVEGASAIVVAGGAAVAAVDGYSDELVAVQHQAFIRERTVVVGSCGGNS